MTDARPGQRARDSTIAAALGQLRRRVDKLSVRTEDAEIAALAADVAAVLPSDEVEGQVDMGLVDLLLTDRLSPTPQRHMHQVGADMQGRR